MRVTARVTPRRVRFTWPEDLDPMWTPAVPELAIAANAVSLLMPHAEPYVVAAVRASFDELPIEDPDLAADARAYVSQEAQHHAQHRRFNDILVRHYPPLERQDRAWRWVFRKLRNRGTRFGLAFAAAFETTAFVAARWVDRNQRLLRDADPTTTTMFLWHLAEEVEHKEVAFDVYEASGGGRLRYAWALIVAAAVLAGSALCGSLTMMRAEKRLFSPVAHLRLATWSLGFVFAALPVMVSSALPGHHPRDLADPAGLDHWLDHLDVATATVPEYALP